MRSANESMLRFAFVETVLGGDAAVKFLEQFRAIVKQYVAELESYWNANSAKMPLSGSLALDCGIRGYRSLQEWATHAIRTYQQAKTTKSSRSSGGRS